MGELFRQLQADEEQRAAWRALTPRVPVAHGRENLAALERQRIEDEARAFAPKEREYDALIEALGVRQDLEDLRTFWGKFTPEVQRVRNNFSWEELHGYSQSGEDQSHDTYTVDRSLYANGYFIGSQIRKVRERGAWMIPCFVGLLRLDSQTKPLLFVGYNLNGQKDLGQALNILGESRVHDRALIQVVSSRDLAQVQQTKTEIGSQIRLLAPKYSFHSKPRW